MTGESQGKGAPTSAAPTSATSGPAAAARLIDERIRTLTDWRGAMLAEVRRLVRAAEPEVVEECKWIKPSNPLGVAAWSHTGLLCTGEVYRHVIKVTFARGAALPDPRGMFNSSLEGKTRRAIDIREGEVLDAEAFTALIRAAVAENLRRAASRQLGRSRR